MGGGGLARGGDSKGGKVGVAWTKGGGDRGDVVLFPAACLGSAVMLFPVAVCAYHWSFKRSTPLAGG